MIGPLSRMILALTKQILLANSTSKDLISANPGGYWEEG
jgi:hypothetical protein